jgi:cytochrome c peroxidase
LKIIIQLPVNEQLHLLINNKYQEFVKNYFTLLIIFSVFIFISTSCGSGEEATQTPVDSTSIKAQALLDKASQFFQPLPDIAADETHPITDAKVSLGKMLYYDTRLSMTGKNSCNSCHNLNTYGVDNEKTSLGDAGKRGTRNSPTVLNAALHSTQFWDGRAKDVEEQAGMPVMNPVEMAIPHEGFMVKRLANIIEYQEGFKAAFPEQENPITFANMANAIGAFERTLITPSKFDDFLKGDLAALSAEEQHGLKVFMQVGCTNCHIGPVLGGNMFQKFGLFKDYHPLTGSEKDDAGRMDFTKSEIDKDIFKVPSLRNIEKTFPYFHDGSIAELNKVIRIMGEVQLNKNLSDEEVTSIEIFLKALTADVPESVKQNPLAVNQ